MTIQDKCVILQENYRQIRNIREDGNKNTENNGVKSPCRLYVWRLAHTAGAGCKRAICLHEEWVAEQNIKGGVRLERHHAQTAPCHIFLQQPVVEAMYRWCLYRPRTAWLFPLSVIGQTASLSIYRKNKQASLVDAVSRLGHDGEVYDYFFSGG